MQTDTSLSNDLTCEQNIRTVSLIGNDAFSKLASARVAVFGIGGVGGYVAEALARAGVGALDLFDGDIVSVSNINRQIIALHSTVGQPKAEIMARRVADINPSCRVVAHKVFYLPDNADSFPLDGYDYIADAVDNIAAKTELALRASALGIKIISAMGAGNRTDFSSFRVADIYETSGCPLARVMRRELKRRGVERLKVVYSPMLPASPNKNTDKAAASVSDAPVIAPYGEKRPPASISFVPSAVGLMMAGEIIRELAGIRSS